jgi:hypothetical protein
MSPVAWRLVSGANVRRLPASVTLLAIAAMAWGVPVSGAHSGADPDPRVAERQQAGAPGGTFTHVPGLGLARRATSPGLLEVRAADGQIFTTHGHDVIDGQELPPGTTPQYFAEDELAPPSNVNTTYPSVRNDPICANAPTPRVRVFYVQPADRPNRASTYSDMMRDIMRAMNGWLRERGAAYSNGDLYLNLRTQCSATGTIIVNTFHSRQNAGAVEFAALRDELIAAGYARETEKYLLLWDSPFGTRPVSATMRSTTARWRQTQTTADLISRLSMECATSATTRRRFTSCCTPWEPYNPMPRSRPRAATAGTTSTRCATTTTATPTRSR